MSRAFVKETAESAAPPERMVDDGPNLVTPEGLAQIEAHIARIESAMQTEANVLLRETLARDLRYWTIRKSKRANRTVTRIAQLADSERLEELASMLRGESRGETTRQEAAAMLEAARRYW